jgi:dihydrofolate reductase
MNVFIITAISADGFIARDSHHPAIWTSKEDKKRFVELTKRAGVIVMGLNTFRTLSKPLKDRLNIVYSNDTDFNEKMKSEKMENLEITSADPKDLIESLERRGFKEVAICGGSQIYTTFMKTGLVGSLYLTIEPILFGKGMNIFNDSLDEKNQNSGTGGQILELISSQTTPAGTILLEYKIK